jgi:tRNA threonylcarbamoyladenosine biosynthesis protein TsaB
MSEVTLVLEAATGTGSVALVRGPEVIAEATVPMRGADGERLMPTLVQLLHEAGVPTIGLGRVICSGGPGGFTSLRIAAAIGKGLAESLGIPLWSMSSLGLLAVGALGEGGTGGWSVHEAGAARSTESAGANDQASVGAAEVIAVLDAMRGEWYARQFAAAPVLGLVARGDERLVGREALAEWAGRIGAVVVGAGGETFDRGRSAVPQARDVVRLPDGPLLHPVDLAAWEPGYGRLAEAQVKWEQAHGRPLGPVG